MWQLSFMSALAWGHWTLGPISIVNIAEVLFSILYINSGSVKKLVQKLIILHLQSRQVGVALCKHVKSAVLSKYEHLLVCSAELKNFFFSIKMAPISLFSGFSMIYIYFDILCNISSYRKYEAMILITYNMLKCAYLAVQCALCCLLLLSLSN